MTVFTLELPTSETPNYSYTTGLDGKEYKFNFKYRVTTTSWYLSIYKLDGTLLLSGVRLVPWLDLIAMHTKVELPQGNLFVVPLTTSYPKAPVITLENLSVDFQLLYNSVT
jgi:hypothetical protein